jgi:hypothetical protein
MSPVVVPPRPEAVKRIITAWRLFVGAAFARGTPIGFSVNHESFAFIRLTQPGRERGMGQSNDRLGVVITGVGD